MYFFDSRVRYSEADEQGRLTLAGMVDYFQDTSTFQAEDLGIGVEYLKSMGAAWVLNAWQIMIHSRPVLGERIRTGTAPYSFKGYIGLRNFVMEDADGNRLAEANSIWTLLHLEKGIPVRATQEMLERYRLEPKLEMDYAPRKIALPGEGVPREAFSVERHHLDGNHHVNNGQYVHMAMEYLPPDFTVGQMRAEYKKQARLKDRIVPVVREGEGLVTVALCGADGQPYAVVEFSKAR